MPVIAAILCLFLPLQSWAIAISHVYHEPKYFDPMKEEQSEINFTLTEDARVIVKLFDDRGELVRKIENKGKKGSNNIIWDGMDMAHQAVPSEAYHYAITAIDDAGESVEYDITDITGGEAVISKNVSWDKKRQKIIYQLSKPSRVVIRLGIKSGGPLMQSLLDWSPRKAGFNEESWDGLDSSGVINLASHPNLDIQVNAYSLSDNAIIVGQNIDKPQYISNFSWKKETRKPKKLRNKKMYAHYQQPAETRADLAIKLSLIGDYEQDNNDIPVVDGIVSVRLDIENEDRPRLLARGFEPIFFLDGMYMHENEMGFLPVTWQLNTKNINEGEHFITGNIRSYEGNFGAATIKIHVRR